MSAFSFSCCSWLAGWQTRGCIQGSLVDMPVWKCCLWSLVPISLHISVYSRFPTYSSKCSPFFFFFFLVVSCVYFSGIFPSDSDSKESVCNAGDPSSIPGLGRSSREGNGSPLQYPYLKNPMDRGACRAIVHWVTKSRT